MTLAQVEKRLTVLEQELREFKRQSASPRRTGQWYVDNAGKFENDPVYKEIVRLGRKYRESLRPKSQRKKKR